MAAFDCLSLHRDMSGHHSQGLAALGLAKAWRPSGSLYRHWRCAPEALVRQ
jgi:hypothetical protein